MDFIKTTEQDSLYSDLEKKDIEEILLDINTEDQKVAFEVKKAISQISALVKIIVEKMKSGGRLFYIGAGTSGRLGILDASECPPTFGVPHDKVIGLIAGGDTAIRKAVEFAEDSDKKGWNDLLDFNITASCFCHASLFFSSRNKIRDSAVLGVITPVTTSF